MPDSIQPREQSKGGGKGGTIYKTDLDGDLNVFDVDHDNDDRWLNTYNGHSDNLYNPDNRIVFVIPRKSRSFSPPQSGEFTYYEVSSTNLQAAYPQYPRVWKGSHTF